MFDALAGRDIQNIPKFYEDFERASAELARHAMPIEALKEKPDAENLVAKLLGSRHRDPHTVRWLPLVARKQDMVMLVNAADAKPIGAVPIDPW